MDIDNREWSRPFRLCKAGGYSTWNLPGEYGYSQRNLGMMSMMGYLKIWSVDMDKEDEVIYMNKLQGWELVLERSNR